MEINTKELYKESSQKFDEVKKYLIKLLPFWVAGSITALVATMYAKLFAICEEYSLVLYQNTGYWFLAIPPLLFFISWYIVEKFSPYANGSGIPQLMAAVEFKHLNKTDLIDKFLSLRIILVKIFSSLIGILGGGAIGREGPTLQISASIFHLIDKNWKTADLQNRHGFLLAGAASGLASAFNTPLGGIVYVVEELAKSHLSGFRTGVLHSVIFAGLISQYMMGPYLYFGYPKVLHFQYSWLYQLLTLSLAAGVVVTFFAQGLKTLVLFRSKIKKNFHKALIAIGTGLIFSSFVVFVSPSALGPGKALLNNFLFNKDSASVIDVLARFVGSFFTYANGGSGGIFAPTLSLGGSVTSFVSSMFVADLGPIAVLIGMTAGLAALTHSPLTSFILILEMTDRYSSIFPLMIAALIGHGVSRLIAKKSFYEFVCEKLIQTVNAKT